MKRKCELNKSLGSWTECQHLFSFSRDPRYKETKYPCNPFCMCSTHLVQHSTTVRIILQSKKSKSLVFMYSARSWTKRGVRQLKDENRDTWQKTGSWYWRNSIRAIRTGRASGGGGFAQLTLPCITSEGRRKIPLTTRLLREAEIRQTGLSDLGEER